MSANSPSARYPTARARRRRRPPARTWAGWGFVGPFLVVFAFALVAPIGYAIYLSLFRQQLIGGNAFVGLDQLHGRADRPAVLGGAAPGALFLVVQVPVMLVLALLAALALDSARLRWAPLFRLAIFLPYAVPAVVATLMWGFMYGTQFGLVARLRSFFGGHFPDPLSGSWVLAAIGNIVTWEFVGYNMLIFYSALRVVPASCTRRPRSTARASSRSSAGSSCPRCAPRSWSSLIFSVIGSFQLFNEPDILQQLAPDAITHATSRRTCTPTTCPSPARSTTTRPRSRSSWASSR